MNKTILSILAVLCFSNVSFSQFSLGDRFLACAKVDKAMQKIDLFYIDINEGFIKFETESGGNELNQISQIARDKNYVSVIFTGGLGLEEAVTVENYNGVVLGLWQEVGSPNYQEYGYCASFNNSIKEIASWYRNTLVPLKNN